MSLTAIQNAINKKKLNWRGGETNVSGLDDKAKKGHLGLNVPEGIAAQVKAAVTAANAAFAVAAAVRAPPGVDWRNNNGNWITSIKDQQNCGSCVSFATCATIEARANIVCNNASLNLDLSENQLF